MKLYHTLKTFISRLYHYVPTPLPVGITEFEAWASSIITTYNFPDNDSVRWALAVKVLHLGETSAYKAKRYFYLTMHKSMANQVVSQVIQDLKIKDQQQRAAAQAAEQAAAATATDAAVEQPQTAS